MEAILNHARSYFQNPTGKNRNANIRLGFMTWMLNSMIALNFSFGIMLSSSSLSGPPLKCHNSPPSEEEICMSNTHFRYVFQAQTEDVTFSFFKLTHWIFFVWGILFLSVQYLWRLWEDGIIQQLCGEFPQACKAIAECDKQASIIEKGIFDLHNDFKRAYVCNYIFNELLAWTLLISNFLYYVFLLHIPHTGYFNLIGNMLKPNLENDIRKFEMDYLIELFPREIACTYFAFDPSGKESSVTYRCKVTNQDANEFLHITAALFSTFLMSLLILHAITVAWKYLHFNKSLGKAYTLELSRISLRNKVILLLVCNNIDTTTKMTLLRKFSDRSVDKDCLLQDALGTP